MNELEYCDSCGSKFEVVYESNVYFLKNDISTGETIWTWFRRIPKRIWVKRYHHFVKNLNEEYKRKFKEKIQLLFNKYFVCSSCGKKIDDQYWRNEESIRRTAFRSLRR